MAGDWIKIEKDLPQKPEVMEIADALGMSEAEVVGNLVIFWAWCDSNLSRACNAVSVTKMRLDRITGVTGFVDALVRVGWLQHRDGKIEVVNFDRHLGKSAKSRAQTRNRVEASREKCNAASVTEALPEKRREEKSIKEGLRPSRAEKFTPLDRETAEAIEHALIQDQPDRKRANLDAWANDVRLMRERDNRTHDQILDLFAWANDDSFWRANILSPAKLRKQWDHLTAKRNSANETTVNSAQRRENANAAAFSALRFEDDSDVAYAAEGRTGDSGGARAIVFDEESSAVHTARGGDVGRDTGELPNQGS